MAALPVNVKRYIVECLACFQTPSEVVKSVKDEFDIDVTRMQVSKYNPEKAMGKNLSAELRALFDETREKFKKDRDAIPIANQNYRLQSLNTMHQKAVTNGNMGLAAQLLEQSAKEVGGAYTNTRKLEGGDPNKPIAVKNTHALSDEQLAAIAASGSP